ncbi:molybdate ABC transporter substrate-binding protein [uncultured Tateyamaria sp.]|uniref:molybdate ABC transporter substrate-binding protein n=1 Tax=uncultured Tateyamaria sp. TaxID=455651 RepID=UPI00262E6EA9|nr:molybdate ABC transporter substrate-binding protein [uncultured Tateyamaria sp.]
MKTRRWIKGLALACAALTPVSPALAETVRVFAAASLQGPLDAVAEDWDAEVVISYGGSGAIARQVSQGAPADVVILANVAWSDWLVDGGHVMATPRALLSNSLVVIGPDGAAPLPNATAATLLGRLTGGRLAMGQHMSVPAGIYAHAWLTQSGAWGDLSPHLAETENVRAALALVAREETPLGIVYASDAAASDDVSVLWDIPKDSHPAILYPGLALTPFGADFLDHLATRTDVFVAAGFSLP